MIIIEELDDRLKQKADKAMEDCVESAIRMTKEGLIITRDHMDPL